MIDVKALMTAYECGIDHGLLLAEQKRDSEPLTPGELQEMEGERKKIKEAIILIENDAPMNCCCKYCEENRWAYEMALAALREKRTMAKCIRVDPVVHGKLKSTGMDEMYAEFGKCTVCGGDNYIKVKFCNWCGARMDGGDGHDEH